MLVEALLAKWQAGTKADRWQMLEDGLLQHVTDSVTQAVEKRSGRRRAAGRGGGAAADEEQHDESQGDTLGLRDEQILPALRLLVAFVAAETEMTGLDATTLLVAILGAWSEAAGAEETDLQHTFSAVESILSSHDQQTWDSALANGGLKLVSSAVFSKDEVTQMVRVPRPHSPTTSPLVASISAVRTTLSLSPPLRKPRRRLLRAQDARKVLVPLASKPGAGFAPGFEHAVTVTALLSIAEKHPSAEAVTALSVMCAGSKAAARVAAARARGLAIVGAACDAVLADTVHPCGENAAEHAARLVAAVVKAAAELPPQVGPAFLLDRCVLPDRCAAVDRPGFREARKDGLEQSLRALSRAVSLASASPSLAEAAARAAADVFECSPAARALPQALPVVSALCAALWGRAALADASVALELCRALRLAVCARSGAAQSIFHDLVRAQSLLVS